MLNLERYSKYWSFYHTRHKYYASREEYYTNLIDEKTPSQLLALCHNQSHLHKTDASLQFKGLHFGTTHRKISRQLGRPKFSWQNPLFRPHQVKVYRLNIHHIFCYATLHFINSRLFIVDTRFKNLSDNNTDRILNTLKSKYLSDSENDFNNGVIDNSGNMLLVEQNHYLSIKYVAGDIEFQNAFSTVLQKKQGRKVSIDIKLNTALAEYL